MIRHCFLIVSLSLVSLLVGCQEEGAKTPRAVEDTKAKPQNAIPQATSMPQATSKTTLGHGERPSERDQIDADGVVRRGDTLPTGKTFTVSECVAQAASLQGKEILVRGRVAQVCANKGCWWSIENPENPSQRIRVTHKDYSFFVPSKVKGKTAVAFGVLEVKELSVQEAEHLARDEGQTAIDTAKLPTVELRLQASALEMKAAG